MPFKLLGASDVNANFRAVAQANYEYLHFWSDMASQVEGGRCLLHEGLANKFGCSEDTCQADVDLWVMGTPCPPFSDQNNARSIPGAVEKHPLYNVTFEDAVAAVSQGHRAYLMEQVPGFHKPYDSTTDETPMDRSLSCFRLNQALVC